MYQEWFVTWPSVLQLKVLVLKLCAVNGLSSSSITSSKVSSLANISILVLNNI